MDTSSIGIIGGADGPTAVYYYIGITPTLITMLIVAAVIIMLITASITYFICRKKYRKEANSQNTLEENHG